MKYCSKLFCFVPTTNANQAYWTRKQLTFICLSKLVNIWLHRGKCDFYTGLKNRNNNTGLSFMFIKMCCKIQVPIKNWLTLIKFDDSCWFPVSWVCLLCGKKIKFNLFSDKDQDFAVLACTLPKYSVQVESHLSLESSVCLFVCLSDIFQEHNWKSNVRFHPHLLNLISLLTNL